MSIGRNSFIQMTKLSNVKGRISYISSHAKQENLYAVYETTERKFWRELAKCNQEEYVKSGTEGKCIEARELIIALPESFTEYQPDRLLQLFTNHFKQNYGIECIAALHHNKRKTNYHIHLIFAERKLLDEPIIKTASRNMFYDENGKHVRTKKEILGEDGEIREGCRIVKKGGVYSALTSLITKNSKERVQMGSYRFIFAFSTSLLIQAITVGFVDKCGGDAAAWRTVAIIYAIIGLVVNTISALSIKELPEEELNEGEVKDDNEKYGMIQAFKLLVKNKYYMMICGTYILQQLYGAMIGAGIYYMTWVLKNKNLFGQFAWAVNIPLIIALIFTPTLVGKWKGMYKLNLRGYVLAVIGRALVVVAGYMGSVPLMMAFTALAALGQGPWQGDMNAVIASCSEYTYLTQGKRIDGTMYSCTSLGVKIGGGIGTAVVGWLLEFSGYIGTNATQPQSALDMMQFMYLWLPLIFDVLIMFVLSRMNVEDANKKLKAEKGLAADEVTDASDIN